MEGSLFLSMLVTESPFFLIFLSLFFSSSSTSCYLLWERNLEHVLTASKRNQPISF
jgi:hypothetical protein